MVSKNTICLWFNDSAVEAAKFYAETFPDSAVGTIHHAPGDYPSGKQGDVLMIEFAVMGIPCIGLNGGPAFKHSEAFSFQVATDDQAETDRLWNAIVGNGVVADHAPRPHCRDRRPRSRGGQTRFRGDDADGKDRHRRDRSGPARLRIIDLPFLIGKRTRESRGMGGWSFGQSCDWKTGEPRRWLGRQSASCRRSRFPQDRHLRGPLRSETCQKGYATYSARAVVGSTRSQWPV
jgi:predicted 3-demethylubiquinone-9 3-methyltransferase (glyoxalase superfamily)